MFLRPKLEDRFLVQGAETWKRYNDINGEVVYKGEVSESTAYGKETQIGVLVFDRKEQKYIIKADNKHKYSCTTLDGLWIPVPL